MHTTLIVLGDMIEMEGRTRDLHIGMIPCVVHNQIDILFGAERFAREMCEDLPEELKAAYIERGKAKLTLVQ